MKSQNIWPALPYNNWSDTLDTLHMKMQIIGKIKLALNPFLNQWWEVAFYLNAKGMTTGLIPYNEEVFEIEFDFVDHIVNIRTSQNQVKIVPLIQNSVAEFYSDFMETLNSMGISVSINTLPNEFPDPVRFEIDHGHSSYDKAFVNSWWKALIQIHKVFERFRTSFQGKSSPIHFFWGSFDLCETRFSGKPCPIPEGADIILKYAENEENFTFGFWPGSNNYQRAAFYSYFYPAPKDIESISIYPEKASFNKNMGEFILDYDDVLNSPFPGELILEFLNETYEKGAKAGGWNVEALRCQVPDKSLQNQNN